MLNLTTLIDIFNLYVKLRELYGQNCPNIEILEAKCTSNLRDKERYLKNCIVILC